jgi:prepilin-type N-terminal cleavage/methylation domain-containing protein
MQSSLQKAFTLIELLVVVSIMMILALVVMTAIIDARKESRDTARATTAEQLSLGIRLYKEAEGKYPAYPNGVELGVGNPIDIQLAPFLREIPKDPLTSGSGDEYEYWYYPNFLCNGVRHDVVIVKQMEMGDNGNFDEVCGGAPSGFLPSPIYSIMNTVYAQGFIGGQGGGAGVDDNTGGGGSSCTASLSPSSITIPQSGSTQVSVSWTSYGESTIDLIYPNGTSVRQWDYNGSPSPISIQSTMPTGLYTVNVYEQSRSSGTSRLCALSLQVNPITVTTQCNDGVDNADAEDTFADAADPGCHTGDDISGPYDPAITSESNAVAPGDYGQSSYYSQSSYGPTVENYTPSAYIVFIN